MRASGSFLNAGTDGTFSDILSLCAQKKHEGTSRLSPYFPYFYISYQLITNFYSSDQAWLPEEETVRECMSNQTWEVQWKAGLEIWKQAMQSGIITWRP
jgi:hypothetical protein